jgi:hypothetical protein
VLFIFSTPVLIKHLWQLKTVVVLHWCLIRTVLLFTFLKHAVPFCQGFMAQASQVGSVIIEVKDMFQKSRKGTSGLGETKLFGI